MNKLKSLLLFLAMLTAWPAAAQSIVGILTADELARVGITAEKTAVAAGTVILSNDAGELRLAYADDWGSIIGYGTRSYRSMTVGDSGEIFLDRGVVGNTNPTFTSYEEGVMAAGAVFELTAKKTGWMTLMLRMSANKQYVVFEGRTKGIPYTLGMARDDCKINYSLPATESGDIDFSAPDADKYFIPATRQATDANGIPLWIIEGGEVIASEEKPEGATPVREEIEPHQNAPQFVNVIGGVEDETFAAQSFTGFLTFRVTAGLTYYFSALGSKAGCGGFIFTPGNVQPKVTFPATDELPEVKFDSVLGNVHLAAGDDFEYDGLWYAVLDADAKTCMTKGYKSYDVSGEIIIPSQVVGGSDEYTVVGLEYGSFSQSLNITGIVLPETVETIGERAFFHCESLTTVQFSSNLNSIGARAFEECSGLVSVELPEGLISLGDHAFYNCTNLQSVSLPSTLEEIEQSTFHICDALSTINFSEGLTTIGSQAFSGAKGLTSLTLPETLTDIGFGAFDGCTRLTYVSIPSGVTTIGNRAFAGNTRFDNIEYQAVNPIVADESVFGPIVYTKATLNMPNATLESVQATTPWNKFEKIFAIDSYPDVVLNIIPNVGKVIALKDIEVSFNGVNKVEWTVYGAANAPYVINAEGDRVGTFTALDALENKLSLGLVEFRFTEKGEYTVVIPEGSYAFHINNLDIAGKEIRLLYEVVGFRNISVDPATDILNEIGTVKVTFNEANAVTLPDDLGTYNTPYLAYVLEDGFREPRGTFIPRVDGNTLDLTISTTFTEPGDIVVVVPGTTYLLDGEEGVDFEIPYTIVRPELASGEDFQYESLWYTVIDSERKTVKTRDGQDSDNPGNRYEGALTIPPTISYNNNEYTVVEIGNRSFCSLSGLTSVSMPSTVVKLGEAAFEGCENLVSVELSDSLREIEGFVFDSCVVLTSITLPEGLEYVGERMFAHCHSLTSAVLPSTIKEIRGWAFGDANLTSINLPEGLETIGGEALTQNRNLASIDIPNTVTAIWDRAFSTTRLTSLVLPEGVELLGDGAFYHCYELESVVIPASVNSIGLDVFGEGDDKLVSVTYNAEQPIEANPWIFGQGDQRYMTAILNMPNATLATIQAVTPWNLFQRINAKDGSVMPPLNDGADFEYEGLTYTVIDSEARTCRTKAGFRNEDNGTVTSGNNGVGDVVIPSVVSDGHHEYRVLEIGAYGFYNNENMSSVLLPESLVSIQESAFSRCVFTSIDLPDSLEVIGNSAFSTTPLTSLVGPGKLRVIEDEAFLGNSHMNILSLPASLESMGDRTFNHCTNLQSVTYLAEEPREFPENVFYSENEVEKTATLYTPNATIASVRSTAPWNRFGHIVASDGSYGFAAAGDDFEYDGIRYTVIDNEAKTVKTREGHRSDGETVGGNNVSGDVVIPATVSYDGNEYTVVEIGRYSFWGNTEMTSVSVPETVKAVETDAFEECSALTKATFANLEALCDINFRSSTSNPLYLTHHLYIGDEEVTEVVIPESVTAVKSFTFTGGSNITSVTFHDGITSIGSAAFDGCSGLTAVELPESVASIGEVAFANCSGLTSVLIPANVTSIRNYVFNGCNNISTVIYNATEPISASENIFPLNGIVYASATLQTPNATLAAVQATVPWNKFGHIVASDGSYGFVSDGDEFEYEGLWYTVTDTDAKTCRTREGSPVSLGQALTVGNTYEGNLRLPSKVTYNSEEFTVTEVGNYGFSGVSGLTSVIIPESVSRIGMDAFYQCSGLVSVILPSNLADIEAYAFSDCKALTEISLPDSLRSVSNNLFAGCPELRTVVFPNGLTAIGERAFSETSIEELTIPEGVTTIGLGAFYGCRQLVSVSIPSSLQTAGISMFGRCQNIEDIIYRVNEPIAMGSGTFEEIVYSVAVLNMPDTPLDVVRSTDPWRRFNHIIASDGTHGFVEAGDEFEYEGITYTVIDAEAFTCKTKDGELPYGSDYGIGGNNCKGDLTIPSIVTDGTYEYSVVAIGEYGFCHNTELTTVSLPSTVTSIGRCAFAQCEDLESIRIPESVTEMVGFTFSHCTNLTEVNIPSGVTIIRQATFQDCSALEKIEIPASVVEIERYAFANCSSLASVDLPDNLTSVGEYGFAYSGLRSVDIPAAVESFGECAFYRCEDLASVTYSAVTPVSAAEDLFDSFTDVYAKATLNMPNATLASIRATVPWNRFVHIMASDGSVGFVEAGEDFEYDGILYTVIDAEARTVKTKDGSPEDDYKGGNVCRGNVVIPSIVSDGTYEYTVVELGTCTFGKCTELTSVTLPNTLTKIGVLAFRECTGMPSIDIPESVLSIEMGAFWDAWSLRSINIPESVVSIGSHAFAGCYSLSSVTIPASVTSFGEKIFEYCDSIKTVTYLASTPVSANENLFYPLPYAAATLHMPNATLASVQSMTPWNLFKHIEAADGSVVPGLADGDEFEYEGITYTVIDAEAFTCKTKDGELPYGSDYGIGGNNCKGDLTIPSIVTDGTYEYSVVAIGEYGFCHNTELTTVSLPSTVTSIGWGAFAQCEDLESISIPESVTEMVGFTFSHCTNLTEVNIPSGVTIIRQATFQDCSALEKIEIPASVVEIEGFAFAHCSSLASVDLPDNLTSVGEYAFAYSGLRSVDIPAAVESFGECAFYRCEDLASVTYSAVTPVSAAEDLFDSFTDVYAKATLNMPNATLASIRATVPWNRFVHIMASDGSAGFVEAGDDFDFGGIKYTVIDAEAKTVRTADGGNPASGDLVIPATVNYQDEAYSVTEIGKESFAGSDDLRSVTLPATITEIGADAFADCERLTSLVWTAERELPANAVSDIANPNLLVYVEDDKYAPEGLHHNVVANNVCANLVLTPGYAFTPVKTFTAEHSEMTKAFTQQTPVDGCAGWETLTLPFEPTAITAADGRILVPFAALADISIQCPFWLYEADETGVWKEAPGIRQGVPYIISMPNNEAYDEQFRIDGNVTFQTDVRTEISPSTCAPYALTWNSGREFRSLWLPLTDAEAFYAMGLNAGRSGLTGDDGQLLAPGSAFHADVLPKPMEAYVTRIDARRAMPVRGEQSFAAMLSTGSGLRVTADFGSIILSSDSDRTVDVMTTEGITVRHAQLKGGETYRIDNLMRGIYIVAGRKITVK